MKNKKMEFAYLRNSPFPRDYKINGIQILK